MTVALVTCALLTCPTGGASLERGDSEGSPTGEEMALAAPAPTVSPRSDSSRSLQVARASNGCRTGLLRFELHQGRDVCWWARRAVQARKDANVRGQTIRTLQRELRRRWGPPYGSSTLERGFLCIHSHEGSWTDPNAPHYGGLQMDYSFQRSYGPEFLRAWGTADRWPVSVQLAVAMRAYLSGRGYGPWPNTRRKCGL